MCTPQSKVGKGNKLTESSTFLFEESDLPPAWAIRRAHSMWSLNTASWRAVVPHSEGAATRLIGLEVMSGINKTHGVF